MRKIASVLSAAVLTLTLCACSSGSSTSSITVAGSTTCLPIAEIAAEGFKEEAGTDVLVSGLGSSAGIEAVSNGTADIASSSRGLNADEQDLGLTPIVIAHDGIAVIVNDDNPVDNLSTEQLRDIYAGKITNWKEVGGEDLAIVPFQRGEDSGSQTLFRKLLIQGGELMDPPTELAPAAMGELVDSIAAYNNSANAIGFSVYYYIDQMYSQPGLRLLAVDGVTPSNDTIASESYPLCNEFYAVLHADAAADSPERQLYDWLDTAAGQDCIKKSGYVAVAPTTAANSAV